MSHELRTPLNSILILGQQLGDNPDGNLTDKQVEFARTIHGAGTDLLNLISDILDLSKIESGTVSVDAEEISFTNLRRDGRAPFRHEAERRHLSFDVELDPHLDRSIVTDSKRLQQVLKNLLSNAFKFTDHGGVRLRISAASGGWSADHPDARQSALGRRLRGHRHRHRHLAREAEDHLRGLPAGRRQHQPQVRRHRPRPRHQPRACQPARRRDPAAQHARQGQHVHALSAAQVCRPAARRRRPGASSAASSAEPPVSTALPGAAGRADRRRPRRPEARATRSLLIVEDDPHYARILVDLAHDNGFKVLLPPTRRRRAGAGQRLSPDRRVARRVPARTCWAGPSSASSSRTRRRGIFRCRSSPSTRTASTAWRAARSRS